MARYDSEDYGNGTSMARQRDLVLAVNEFCFLQSKTNGAIKTYTGPITMTISAQEALVVFNSKTKQFEETQDFNKAKQLFVSAPEGWYIVLKNPAADNAHPDAGKAANSPDLAIGRKINVSGPCSFSLYPGQMAKTVQGHRLRSNQYLLARVYDAEAAEASRDSATIVDAEGKEVENKTEKYFVGQLLVIKGTEVSFYMPPTGIEVIAVGGFGDKYVREAVTLERLEYAILKDEDGEKRYVHGPAVVFPKPTETFVESPKGGSIFRALELSPISGIYVKVIAAYKDDNGTEHPIGEELFITGKDQMIYYPRPEHAMIQYDGKYMHHAIAIPEGEGRYILNRLTGEIKTIKGPQMYLPDPRTEVVVKRKLTTKECQLLYPGNMEVLEYNHSLNEKVTEKLARKGGTNAVTDAINGAYSTSNQLDTLAIFEANANISRGVSYTKPRTITLDTKYDGVVAVNVWTGYAINVVSKTGDREVIVGPMTRLLDYDETLESMELSTGNPKTTDRLLNTAYLRVENNKVSDIIGGQTKDFVDVNVKVSYCVNFLEEYKNKWFSVDNYVKFLTDRMRSMLKKEIKKYTIQEFYANSTDIVRNLVLDINRNTEDNGADEKKYTGRVFIENGMNVVDVEVLAVHVDRKIANLIEAHQTEMIEKTLELTDAEARMKVITALADVDRKKSELENANALYELSLNQKLAQERFAREEEMREKQRAAKEAEKRAEADMQKILDAIQAAELARKKATVDAEIARQKELAEIEKAKQTAYAQTIEKIMSSVTPDLIAALSTKANAELFSEATKNIGPYAIAGNESISDTVNKLMRGTPIEGILEKFKVAE
jgi:major vault protein